MKRAALALAFATLALGCSSDDDHEHAIDTSGTDSILALTGDASAGETLYSNNCSSCHATDGSGGIGPSLIDGIPGLSDAEVAGAIRNGIEDNMPSYEASLTEQEIADLVAYLVGTFG